MISVVVKIKTVKLLGMAHCKVLLTFGKWCLPTYLVAQIVANWRLLLTRAIKTVSIWVEAMF